MGEMGKRDFEILHAPVCLRACSSSPILISILMVDIPIAKGRDAIFGDIACSFGHIYLHLVDLIPRTQLTSVFEGPPSKTRPFPIKTKVIWVLGIYICISVYLHKTIINVSHLCR